MQLPNILNLKSVVFDWRLNDKEFAVFAKTWGKNILNFFFFNL